MSSSGSSDVGHDAPLRSAAHRRWTSIEHELTDAAPWVPLVTRSWVNLVSARLGNFQVSPEWGLLIDQMWVHQPKRQQTTLAKEHS